AALPLGQRSCDLVEARLDLAAPAGGAGALPDLQPFFAPMRLLEASGSPVLATIRLVADGGRWTSDAERLPWFQQAALVASWVDIEVESAIAAAVVSLARAAGRRVIVSHHDFGGTPTDAALDRLVERAWAAGGDVVKIATRVETAVDHDRLIDLLRRWRDRPGVALALVGMGPIGTPLRSYLPCVGSRLTYGYLDAVAAPGQLHAGELTRRLRADCPPYAQAHHAQTEVDVPGGARSR
ncbi:MAG: type I 3-dehydroquinate dehydratase, partial [Bacteroidota bacterium]